MSPAQDLKYLTENFVYVPDNKDGKWYQKDKWRVLDLIKDSESHSEKYYGDCEDFALTALYLLSKKSWWRFWMALITRKAKILHCTVGGEGHAILRYNGFYIDNIQREWFDNSRLTDRGYKLHWGGYGLYIPYQVALKMLIGRIK